MIGKLSPDQMNEVLASSVTGRIGFHDGQKVYIMPINYIYEGHHILAHSANGLKVQVMRQNPHVCFEVEQINGPNSWSSVIVWGTFQELHLERDRYHALKEFLKKKLYFNLEEKALPKSENDIADVLTLLTGNFKPVIYRIIISDMTGRYEHP